MNIIRLTLLVFLIKVGVFGLALILALFFGFWGGDTFGVEIIALFYLLPSSLLLDAGIDNDNVLKLVTLLWILLVAFIIAIFLKYLSTTYNFDSNNKELNKLTKLKSQQDISRVKRLKELYDKGLLSLEEYESQTKKYLK